MLFFREPQNMFFASLYHPTFWSGDERLAFMEKLYDFLWKQKHLNFNSLIGKCFNDKWDWISLIPESGHLRVLYSGRGTSSNVSLPNYYSDSIESIRYWRNCCHQYNDHILQSSNEIVSKIFVLFRLNYFYYTLYLFLTFSFSLYFLSRKIQYKSKRS